MSMRPRVFTTTMQTHSDWFYSRVSSEYRHCVLTVIYFTATCVRYSARVAVLRRRSADTTTLLYSRGEEACRPTTTNP